MPYRAWLFIVALGLSAVAGLGQAQEETQDAHGQTSHKHSPTQTLPFSIPVNVVEDQATADARKRREEEARQREISDLVAQQGMNAATQSIDAATQDMRDYALYSTLLVAFGTMLLFYTLWLTRQANRAAQAAVDVTLELGQKQLRAHIDTQPSGKIMCKDHPRKKSFLIVTAEVEFKNVGQTPAYKVDLWGYFYRVTLKTNKAEIDRRRVEMDALTQQNGSITHGGVTIGPQSSYTKWFDSTRVLKQDWDAMVAGEKRLALIGRVQIQDEFGYVRNFTFEHFYSGIEKRVFSSTRELRSEDQEG